MVVHGQAAVRDDEREVGVVALGALDRGLRRLHVVAERLVIGAGGRNLEVLLFGALRPRIARAAQDGVGLGVDLELLGRRAEALRLAGLLVDLLVDLVGAVLVDGAPLHDALLAQLVPRDAGRAHVLLLLLVLVLQRRVVVRDQAVVVAIALQRRQLRLQLRLNAPRLAYALVLALKLLRASEAASVLQVLLHRLVAALDHLVLAALVLQLALAVSAGRCSYAKIAVLGDQRVVVDVLHRSLLQRHDLSLLIVHQVVIVLTKRLGVITFINTLRSTAPR